jgi:hypothetical protein
MANEQRVVLRARRPPGSIRCCGPTAVALAMVAGLALFFVMQGYETPGVKSPYQCLPLGIGLVAFALTVINLVEIVQREEIVFDAVKNMVARRESLVPGVVYLTRWSIPFSRIQAVNFRKVRGGTWPPPVWGVYLLLFDDQNLRVDRSSDHEKMFALANYLAEFLRVEIVE